jgi:hypothetical protein
MLTFAIGKSATQRVTLAISVTPSARAWIRGRAATQNASEGTIVDRLVDEKRRT